MHTPPNLNVTVSVPIVKTFDHLIAIKSSVIVAPMEDKCRKYLIDQEIGYILTTDTHIPASQNVVQSEITSQDRSDVIHESPCHYFKVTLLPTHRCLHLRNIIRLVSGWSITTFDYTMRATASKHMSAWQISPAMKMPKVFWNLHTRPCFPRSRKIGNIMEVIDDTIFSQKGGLKLIKRQERGTLYIWGIAS